MMMAKSPAAPRQGGGDGGCGGISAEKPALPPPPPPGARKWRTRTITFILALGLLSVYLDASYTKPFADELVAPTTATATGAGFVFRSVLVESDVGASGTGGDGDGAARRTALKPAADRDLSTDVKQSPPPPAAAAAAAAATTEPAPTTKAVANVSLAAPATDEQGKKKKTLTIIVDTAARYTYGLSIFQAKTLDRFSTGRMDFDYYTSTWGRCIEANETFLDDVAVEPCLVVTNKETRSRHCLDRYPKCKLMVVSDEFCKTKDEKKIVDVRLYHGGQYNYTAYLPLGPRRDFWASYQNITSSAKNGTFAVAPPSERKYVYNAMFSLNTSPKGRRELANILNDNVDRYPNATFLQLARKWVPKMEESKHHMHPSEYVDILLKSVFTLSPTGHNPECFRMWEAIEAGSIPVIALDRYYRTSRCRRSLLPMLISAPDRRPPIVILDDWKDLYTTLDRLLENRTALDAMQVDMKAWYEKFMRSKVSAFEDLFLDDDSDNDDTSSSTPSAVAR